MLKANLFLKLVIFLCLSNFITSCNTSTTPSNKEVNPTKIAEVNSDVTTENTSEKEESTPAFSYDIKKFGDEQVNIAYPEVVGENAKMINDKIVEVALALADGEESKNIESAIKKFKTSAKEDGEKGEYYDLSISNSDIYLNEEKGLFSFALDWSGYQGGAHPNSGSTSLTFDIKTGNFIEIKNIVLDASALLQIAEEKFRAANNIKPNEPLNKEGHDFPDNQFVLPTKGIHYSAKGLMLYYNPYEIAPYVLGGTELLIPYKELAGANIILGY